MGNLQQNRQFFALRNGLRCRSRREICEPTSRTLRVPSQRRSNAWPAPINVRTHPIRAQPETRQCPLFSDYQPLVESLVQKLDTCPLPATLQTVNIVRRPDAEAELKAIGADAVIASTGDHSDLSAKVKQVTGPNGAYAAIDAVAGDILKVSACLSLLPVTFLWLYVQFTSHIEFL